MKKLTLAILAALTLSSSLVYAEGGSDRLIEQQQRNHQTTQVK